MDRVRSRVHESGITIYIHGEDVLMRNDFCVIAMHMGGVYQELGRAKPPMIILLGARGAKPPMHGNVSIFEFPDFCV